MKEDANNNSELIQNNQEYLSKTSDKVQIIWPYVLSLLFLHIGAAYGLLIAITDAKYQTIIFTAITAELSLLGTQVGVHRLWSHKSFKANFRLRLILAFFQTMAAQGHIFWWSQSHRVHHKYSETDADPHDSRKGFIFAHMGWLIYTRNQAFQEKVKLVDVADLLNDPIVVYQRKYYVPLVVMCLFIVPTAIPYYFWNESLTCSFFVSGFLRYIFTLNLTFLVNSAAHMWGNKPYDKRINPVDMHLRYWLNGEGAHNFHHTFPWDYSGSEFGVKHEFNPPTLFIDLFAKIGWAYDLKKATVTMVENTKNKYGDSKVSRIPAVKDWVLGIMTVMSMFIFIMTMKPLYQISRLKLISSE